jgi:multisubunit Na+/H+ antiporter MnhF subunit
MNILALLIPAGWCLLTAVAFAGLWRIARGPTIFDRIIGLDTALIAVVGMIVLFSIAERTGEHLELVIVITALGFFTTVAYFYYQSQSSAKIGERDREETS